MEYWVSKSGKQDAWCPFLKKNFGFEIFEKDEILRPLFFCLKNNNCWLCVYRVIVWYNFQYRLRGGGAYNAHV